MKKQLMQKLMMIGVILSAILSCVTPATIKEPVIMYDLSIDRYQAGVGKRNLNILSTPETVGRWVNPSEVKFYSLDQLPSNLKCFSSTVWLKVVVPKLREGSRQYRDLKD